MSITLNKRVRPAECEGTVAKLHGEYRASFMSGVLVSVAAHTSSVGQIFVMRVPTAETKKAIVRYCSVQWATKTAGTAQPMGFALAVHRGATAVYTGGTAIDMFTVTNSQKLRADQATTMFAVNNVRIATTDTLTVPATQVIDAHPISQKMCSSGALGAVSELVLYDARDDGSSTVRSGLMLAAQEVLVIKNVIAMATTVDGYATVTLEWDEVTV
jgi:hypothetical protein